MIDELLQKCRQLQLKGFVNYLPEAMDMAAKNNWTPEQLMEHLLTIEIELRRQRRIQACLSQAKLPQVATIDQFDFNFEDSRKKQKSRILLLMQLEFISQKADIIFIGNPGVGKTFLANCIAYAATQKAIKTLFTSAIDMINQLIAAEADRSLLKKLKYYQDPTFLVIDELGYLPLGTAGSNLLFQVISARHQQRSTLITTNLPFAKWSSIFDSTTVATAIADRLVMNSEVLIFQGDSFRKKAKRSSQ